MRLAADKIKQGILHPRQIVREACVLHFSEAFVDDSTIMPVVQQATEKYGWKQVFSPIAFPERLTQTDESIDWLLSLTKRIAQSGDPEENERRLLYSYLLAGADVELLSGHEEKIFACDTLHESVRRIVYERLRLLRVSVDECWKELETFCDKQQDAEYLNDADLVYAEALCDALGRHAGELGEKVLALLDASVTGAGEQLTWLEGFAVRLAGEMRLADAVGRLVRMLHIDSEWLSDECQRSLILLGSDEVVDELAKAYFDGEWSMRLVAASVLARIYSDRSSDALKALMQQETDAELSVVLRQALLTRFDDEAVEIARQFVIEQPLTEDVADLRQDLLAVAELMKVDFPERQKWANEAQQAAAAEEAQTRQVDFPVVDQLDTLVSKRKQEDQIRRERTLREAVPMPTQLLQRQGVGRNDPCPCGSGKKFKKCCMKM